MSGIATDVGSAQGIAGLGGGIVGERIHHLFSFGEGAGLADGFTDQQGHPAAVLVVAGDAQAAHGAQHAHGLGWIEAEAPRKTNTSRQLGGELLVLVIRQVRQLRELHAEFASLIERDREVVAAVMDEGFQPLERDVDVAQRALEAVIGDVVLLGLVNLLHDAAD
ncbi:hypothetical protein D3C76_725370 [compost metagenome]